MSLSKSLRKAAVEIEAEQNKKEDVKPLIIIGIIVIVLIVIAIKVIRK
jgi:hypothetical protein